MTRRIVVIGGAGFEDAPALVPYLLSPAFRIDAFGEEPLKVRTL